MSAKENVIVREKWDGYEIALVGAITEAMVLPVLELEGGTIRLDLGVVSSMNSQGIRRFKTWSHTHSRFTFRLFNCAVPFIQQVNLVPDLLPPTAAIESFFVPYYNEITGEETERLFSTGRELVRDANGKPALVVPTVTDSQGGVFGLDIVPDHYFRFYFKELYADRRG